MIDLLKIDDSLTDKPSFRWLLEEHERDVNELEAILDKVAKTCKAFCETGVVFCDSMVPFMDSITELSKHFEGEEEIQGAYSTFSEHLEEIKSFYGMLLEQVRRSILLSMVDDMKKSLKTVKGHRKAFKDKSDELDAALYQNSVKMPKRKDDEADAVHNLALLSKVKSEFHHTSVDYVYEVNKLQMGKQYQVTDKFLHLMYSFYSFFHQGYLTLQHIDPYLKNLNGLMQQKQKCRDDVVSGMQNRHEAVAKLRQNDYDGLIVSQSSDRVLLEGYLFKRGHNAFKTWKRRYFIIKSDQLLYQKRVKDSEDDESKVVVADLRLVQVKSMDEQDRRYCFELIMPPSKKIFLQADSQKVKDAWIKSLQAGIEDAIHKTTLPTSTEAEAQSRQNDNAKKSGNTPQVLAMLQRIKELPGNQNCADCSDSEAPWASINLGVTLCKQCSGIHRKLGVHISKVRSMELDVWDAEQCLLMLELGNTRVNRIYEHAVCTPYEKPTPTSVLSDRDIWTIAKYEERLFLENRDFVCVQKKATRPPSTAVSYKMDSISFDPGPTVKPRKGRGEGQAAARPFSRIFQLSKKKARGGSDGTVYIDTREDEGDVGYALISTEEPPVRGGHTESCVPDGLLSKAALSSSTPDLNSIGGGGGGLTTDDSIPHNLNLIGPLALNNSLYRASSEGDVPAMFRFLAEGANVNFSHSSENDRSCLIAAVAAGSIPAVQLLLANGAEVDQVEGSRETALHQATRQGYTNLACLLLKRNADFTRVNTENQDVIDLARSLERATLLTVLNCLKCNGLSDPTSQQLLEEFSGENRSPH